MTKKRFFIACAMAALCITGVMAQETDDKVDGQTGATTRKAVTTTAKVSDAPSRLSLGVGGNMVMSRNFYSDNPSRYNLPDTYKDAPSHGYFDIPEVSFSIGYDFGKGWSFGAEIEYEHGGVGTAYEKEEEEGGEWEAETEKGGEVMLEELWIQKSFARWANLRMGQMVVPVGLNNSAHDPMNYFTVYHPEGETTILPATWHQTGVGFWGVHKKFRYEVQFLAGLNADGFSTSTWVNGGTTSPVEFEVATKYGVSLRLDNYSVKGLRLGLSGYYGHTQGNSFPAEENQVQYKGALAVGCLDFTYDAYNWIVRGQADYGYLGDTDQLMLLYNRLNKVSPYHNTARVSSNAYAVGIEAGYDVFSQIARMKKAQQKMYVFGRYEEYNPCADSKTKDKYAYCKVRRIAFGVNYMPIKEIVVKAEYSNRLLRSQYNNEPSLSIGIGFMGWML